MKFLDWLKKQRRLNWKKLSFGFVLKPAVLAGVVSTIVSLGISLITVKYTDELNRKAQQNEDVLNQRNKEEENFRNNAMLFNSAVADFVQDIIQNNQPEISSSDQLVTAIMSEYGEADRLLPYLPEKDRYLVSKYKNALVEMRNIISYSNSILTLKLFWEQMNKILTIRKEIDLALPG